MSGSYSGKTWSVSLTSSVSALVLGGTQSMAITKDPDGKIVIQNTSSRTAGIVGVGIDPLTVGTVVLNTGKNSNDLDGRGYGAGISLGMGQLAGGVAVGTVLDSDKNPIGISFGGASGFGAVYSQGNTKTTDITGYERSDALFKAFIDHVDYILSNMPPLTGNPIEDAPNIYSTNRQIAAAAVKDLLFNKQFMQTLYNRNDPNAPITITNPDGTHQLNTYSDQGELTSTIFYDADGKMTMSSIKTDGRFVTTKYDKDGNAKVLTPSDAGGPERVEVHDTPTSYVEYHYNGTHLTWLRSDDKINNTHSYVLDGLDGHKITNNWGPTWSFYSEDTPSGLHIYNKHDSVAGTEYRSTTQDGSLARSVYNKTPGSTDTIEVTAGGAKTHTLTYASGKSINETSQITRVQSGTSYSDQERKLTYTETNDAGTVIVDQSWWPSNGYAKYYYSLDQFGNKTIQETTESGIRWHDDALKANGDYTKRTLDLGSLRGHSDSLQSGTHDVQTYVIDAKGNAGVVLERTLDTAAGYHQHTVTQPNGKTVLNETSDSRNGTSSVYRYNDAGVMKSLDVVNADHSESHRTWGDDGKPLLDDELYASGAKSHTEWYAGTNQTKVSDSWDKTGLHTQHIEYWSNGRYKEMDTQQPDHSGSFQSFDTNGNITQQITVKADGTVTTQTNFTGGPNKQTIEVVDPNGHKVTHTEYNTSGQATVIDAYVPNSDTLASHNVRDPSTGNDQKFIFTDGALSGITLTYAGVGAFSFAAIKGPNGTLISDPIKPSDFDALFRAEAKHLDAFDGKTDGMITVASDLKVSASNPTITTAINARVTALDASEGKALHDQHLSQTQDLVASYLKASLMHDYHL